MAYKDTHGPQAIGRSAVTYPGSMAGRDVRLDTAAERSVSERLNWPSLACRCAL